MSSAGVDIAGAGREAADLLRAGVSSMSPPREAGASRSAAAGIDTQGLLTWKQVLADLGYLPDRAEVLASARIDEAFREAWGQFQGELQRTPELAGAEAPLPTGINPATIVACNRLLHRVSDLLSHEPVDAPDRVPGAGERNVWTRILQARLQRLDLLQGANVGDPFSRAEVHALRGLVALLSPPDAVSGAALDAAMPRAVRLCGDADALLDALIRRDPHGYLVIYTGAAHELPEHTCVGLHVDPATACFRGEGFLGGCSLFWGRNPRPLLTSHAEAAEDRSNRLGLRLVQIKLWQAGFYRGFIDASFGPRSRAALAEALTVALAGDDASPPGEGDDEGEEAFLRDVGGGYLALNHQLLRRRMARLQPSDAALAAEPDVEMDAGVREMVRRHGAGLAADEAEGRAGMGLFARITSFFKRRILRPLGRVFRTAFVALRRGVHWLTAAAVRAGNAVTDILRSLAEGARTALVFLRRGLQPFLHFVTGQPIGDARAVVRFDLDRDAVLYISPRATPRDLRDHRARVARLSRAFTVTCALVGRAVDVVQRILIGTTPAAWALLAWRLAGLLRRQYVGGAPASGPA